jgi:hypothetical protein
MSLKLQLALFSPTLALDSKDEDVAKKTALVHTPLPWPLPDYRQSIGLDGRNCFWPFQGTVTAVVFIRWIGLIG